MSCGGGHLGFPIGIKNRNLVKDIQIISHLQFGFSQFISFREEDLWNFSQSEHIIGPGSHVAYSTRTKNRYFVEDHPRNIPAKLGSNWSSGFREEAFWDTFPIGSNVKLSSAVATMFHFISEQKPKLCRGPSNEHSCLVRFSLICSFWEEGIWTFPHRVQC
jgi:hypothetical protein